MPFPPDGRVFKRAVCLALVFVHPGLDFRHSRLLELVHDVEWEGGIADAVQGDIC